VLKALRDAVFRSSMCPKYSAEAVSRPPTVLKYKPSAPLRRLQGAKTMHLAAFPCAKSLKMWRIRTLLFRLSPSTGFWWLIG